MWRTHHSRRLLARLLAGGGGGAVLVYLAFRAGDLAAALPAAAAVAAGLGLLWRSELPGDVALAGRVAIAAQLALPGALVVYLSFNAGGFYPRTYAFVALALVLVLVLHATLAENSFGGFRWPAALAAVALSLYCLWTLVSALWSDAPGRALLEFDRALMYLLVLLSMGCIERTPERLRWAIRSVALGMAIVAVAGLLTRLLPDVMQTAPNLANQRLSFPLTYWNALGILAALATILCLHLASSTDEPPPVRVAGAAAVPALATTLFFTFSRGAIAAGLVGLVVYLALGRPRAMLTAAVAVVPATVVVLLVAYQADLLATVRPTTAAAAKQGHGVAVVLALCVAGAAIVRLLLLRFDASLVQVRLPAARRTAVLGTAAAAAVAVLVTLAALTDAPGYARDKYQGFLHTVDVRDERDLRMRLLDPANNGRIDQWNVALDGFRARPVRGLGAGTYGQLWISERPRSTAALTVRDAHSLYLESLAELGIVGLALLGIALLALIAAFAPLRRGRERATYAALFAAAIAWAIHSAIDWNWEMPAVTIWLFALGGLALAAPPANRQRVARHARGRVALGLGLLLLAVAPLAVLVSDRRLDEAADAYARGDCRTAVAGAESSLKALDGRAEPYEVLALCQARSRYYVLAIAALREAIEREPRNWELHYDLALVRGAAGLDPRSAARMALQLNPKGAPTRELMRQLSSGTRADWRRALSPLLDRIELSVVR
jgi:O-antigen ligase